MKCPYCGKTIQKDAQSCKYCGVSIVTDPSYMEGVRLFCDGEYHKAVEKLSLALTLSPDNLEIVRGLGHSYLHSGNSELAYECYERLYDSEHTPIDVIFSYGQDGRLKVRVTIPNTDTQVESELTRENSLPQEHLDGWRQHISGAEPLHDA